MKLKNKIVKIPIWDLENNKIIEMEIDQETLNAMDESHLEHENRLQKIMDAEQDNWTYVEIEGK